MSALFFLASYPRSGNTYVRVLLANYLSGKSVPVKLADLPWLAKGEHIEALWRNITGAAPQDRSFEQEWRGRTAYFDLLRAASPSQPLLVKTHTVNTVIGGEPAFPYNPQDRAIYIVRHPCDVAVSWADFYGVSLDRAVDDLLSNGRYIRGIPHHGYELTGSWGQHVMSWTNDAAVSPALVLRYQDLCLSPSRQLERLASFLGLAVAPDRIDRAVAFSGFKRLQRDEAENGFAEAPANATSGRFFREGRAGQWSEVMSRSQIDRLYDAYAALIDRFQLDEQPAHQQGVVQSAAWR